MAGTFTLEELENHAENFLSKEAFSYYANGTGTGITLRENRAAFSRFVVQINTQHELYNKATHIPIILTANPQDNIVLQRPKSKISNRKSVFLLNA